MSITLAEEKLKLSLPDHTQLPDSEGQTVADENLILYLPDHTQLPESDGTFVKNFQEHPQSILLTESITPVLQEIHPDGQYIIGQDSGIYWRVPQDNEPKERCAVSPDWFYVANVPPLLNGQRRRSYVMWRELIAPLIVIEFVSGDGSEERDRTPKKGKFWIYENVLRVPFYAIYEVDKNRVEVYFLIKGNYQLLPENERGHYPISTLGIELGIWDGVYQNMRLPWLRIWDLQGNLLLSGQELAILERERADLAIQKAERLAAQLKALGIEPEI
ncbi:MAG TPA: Uma2 family endonuclease [Allocoleopsis sp.]